MVPLTVLSKSARALVVVAGLFITLLVGVTRAIVDYYAVRHIELPIPQNLTHNKGAAAVEALLNNPDTVYSVNAVNSEIDVIGLTLYSPSSTTAGLFLSLVAVILLVLLLGTAIIFSQPAADQKLDS